MIRNIIVSLPLILLMIFDVFEIFSRESYLYPLLFIFSFLLLIVEIKLSIKHELHFSKKVLKRFLLFLFSYLIFYIVFGSFYFVKKLNSPYFLNYINIIKLVEDVYPENKEFKILYYNDKYIFVKVIPQDEETGDVHVFKQDAFFNDYSQSKILNDLFKKSKILEKNDSIYSSKIDSLNHIIKKLKQKKSIEVE